ncbi:MAG: prepilin-type N-terminal cleavage/methylation domain-containing protein [Deltaproteobacteria bacterium]|nr:prepilin-type N-terminal cleavage/methylation domain-containing protein [Deltaproteobacteria bacterium]
MEEFTPGHLFLGAMTMGNKQGFTLLELLLIVAILAAVAAGAISAFNNVQEDATLRLANSEMLRIKDAILRFRQDTGYMPKQWPFRLVPDGSVPVPSQGAAWFNSPANFSQLYDNPLSGTGHALETWNQNTSRGWRGPYLTRGGEGYVDIGDGLNADGTGSPTSGGPLNEVQGVADSFIARPVGSYLVWRTSSGGPPHDRWGRPYLLFDLDNTNVRIVCMGPNLIYESNSTGAGGDDIVLYLLK